MSEESAEAVRAIHVRLLCGCGGEMTFDGLSLTSYPPLYPHTCSHCGAKEARRECYPRTRWDPA